MAAATVAWLSGLTRSVPWPNASAARSTGWCGVLKWPSVAGMPRLALALKPNVRGHRRPAQGRPAAAYASMANVVLQDTANAVCRLVVPRCSLASLWKVRPPMVTWLGHCTVLDGVIPFWARPDAVTTLNVEPGGKIPASARSKPPGRSTTASTLPVDGWMTTMSIGFLVAAADTAADAAIWSAMSRLVCTGVPGIAAKRAAVVSTRFPGPATAMVSDGRPASWAW